MLLQQKLETVRWLTNAQKGPVKDLYWHYICKIKWLAIDRENITIDLCFIVSSKVSVAFMNGLIKPCWLNVFLMSDILNFK